MSKSQQLVLAALVALASTAAMAGKARDMGMISHGVGPAIEEAAVQTAASDARDATTVPASIVSTRETSYL